MSLRIVSSCKGLPQAESIQALAGERLADGRPASDRIPSPPPRAFPTFIPTPIGCSEARSLFRRGFMKAGVFGAAGVSLADVLRSDARAAGTPTAHRPSSVIRLWMRVDLLDVKETVQFSREVKPQLMGPGRNAQDSDDRNLIRCLPSLWITEVVQM